MTEQLKPLRRGVLTSDQLRPLLELADYLEDEAAVWQSYCSRYAGGMGDASRQYAVLIRKRIWTMLEKQESNRSHG